MNNLAVKILLNTVLSFLASTIKNPQSVAKFKGIFELIGEGIAAILAALNGGATANKAFGSTQAGSGLLAKIEEAKSSLKV